MEHPFLNPYTFQFKGNRQTKLVLSMCETKRFSASEFLAKKASYQEILLYCIPLRQEGICTLGSPIVKQENEIWGTFFVLTVLGLGSLVSMRGSPSGLFLSLKFNHFQF